MKNTEVTNKAIKRLTTMLFFSLALLGIGFGVNAVIYFKLTETLTKSIWFVSGEQVYKGVRLDDYQVDQVEIKSHAKLFYSFMFSFDINNYSDHIKYASDYLTDVETGRLIQNRFVDQGLYNRLVQSNSSIATVLDSIHVDMNSYPYKVYAECTQYVYNTSGKSNLPFVNTFEVHNLKKRDDNNVHGLQIRNWQNKRVE